MNSSHNTENHFSPTFTESCFSRVNSCRLGDAAVSSLLKMAPSALSYLSSKNNCLRFALCLLSSCATCLYLFALIQLSNPHLAGTFGINNFQQNIGFLLIVKKCVDPLRNIK
ncbi:hypothetical protein CRENBAI_000205 [Crenichthys baileyi]|uniref:Uncharacterized protein n=1 Tax=Crenichthys baileyi TaxID=28760 RepID=A0AAV9QVL3_9TELE